MKKGIKVLSLALALAAVLGMFAACGGGDEPADESQPGEESGTSEPERDEIIIATANEPPTLHPYDHNAVASGYMNALTFATLYRANIETLEPEPMLAESAEAVSDTEWRITLRKGVKFHDGSVMTAEDVKASMEWARDDYNSLTNIYTSWWDDINVVDDNTLTITTNDVYSKTLIDLCRMMIVPKALIEGGNDFNQNPIGAGPYKFVSWSLGDSLEFEAFDDYFLGAPAIKHMTWRIIPEGSSRTIALEAGEIDFIVEVETNDLERLSASDDIELSEKTGTSFCMMILNNEVSPFDNIDFRKGLNSAIDKDSVVEVALNNTGSSIWNQTPTALTGYSDENLQKYDFEEAKKYIAASGIDPSTVSFSCIVSDDTKRRAGEVIQANLQELGMTMELESMDLATYLSVTTDGSFEAAIGGYTSSDMMSFIDGVWTSKSINGSNKCRLADSEIDRLYELATTQIDPAERSATLEQCSARINELCGEVPLYQVNVIRAYNSKLAGVDVSASGGLRWEDVYWAE